MGKPVFHAGNMASTPGVERLQRRGPDQQGSYIDVDPQPRVMVVVVDESDPHANEASSTSIQYGVLYVLRTDDVQDKDVFWFTNSQGHRLRYGIVGEARWDIPHVLTGTDFGVKQFRIRKGG